MNGWRVEIEERGREGIVHYREPARTLSFAWEFGGGDVVAIISVGDPASWKQRHAWASARRADILQRVADAVISQRAPGCVADVDDAEGWIYLREGAAGTPKPAAPASGFSRTTWMSLRAKLALTVLAATVIVGGALLLLKKTFAIRSSSGAPIGLSVRTNQHVATLIQTLEPYVPSLQRDASKDRYRISILLSPLDGRSADRKITIAEGLSTGQLVLPRILGSDGRTLWFDVVGIGGIDVTTFHVVRAEAFRKANPTLDPIWWEDARGMEVSARLRSTSRDQSRAMEFDPVTLKSSAVDVVRNSSQSPFPVRSSQLLAAGVFVSPTSWLGLHSSAEADREFFPKSRVKRIVEATDAKVLRRVYRGTLSPDSSGSRHEIVSMSAAGTDEYLNAAFMRLEESAEPLRLWAPDGYLMIYTAKPGLGGTLVVARVDTNGAIVWKADTGIDRFLLSQILPGERSVAFVGPRPQAPGKVSEPLLVVVESGTGAVRVSSLWK